MSRVVDDATHPIEFGQHGWRAVGETLRIAGGQFDVTAEDRERRAQLVAGIVEKTTLVLRTGLETVEHLVEALDQ